MKDGMVRARPGSLIELIERAAEGVPASKPAVVSADASLDYGSLLGGARSLAGTLRARGVAAGDRVAVWMDKTPRCVQAILGILRSGAAYVPIDPRAPWRRALAIASDCAPAALIVDASHLEHAAALADGGAYRLLVVDAAAERVDAWRGSLGEGAPEVLTFDDALAAGAGTPEPPWPKPSDMAYILYTSGSTGQPKGVVHTHESGLAFTTWVQQRFGIRADDVFSSHAPFHFDLSISDLYASLGSGATVRLISATEGMLAAYLVRMIPEWGITVWYSVPSLLVAMLESGNLEAQGMGSVRHLFFAGEVFPTPHLRRLRRALPHVGLFNLFGPTETNVCTYYEVPPDLPDGDNSPISIGRACEHMETFVLDDTGREVGEGVEGMLWARGGNIMQGYWNDPGRTAATLRPDPRGRDGLAYCTGDLVALQPDGNYRFLGRRDHMIKVRGFRVELGEIESVLTAHPDLVEAVAVPLPDAESGNRIVALVTARVGAQVDASALRAHCGSYLPLYMVPASIEVRAALPRTSTGKVDRTALRAELGQKENS